MEKVNRCHKSVLLQNRKRKKCHKSFGLVNALKALVNWTILLKEKSRGIVSTL